ncbi:conjugal transfer protein TrbE (plasmid) [Skermanella sp. TT6]|uniref:Conjugal transfer protein TrbE n=1 Tax=Skermanella cutis TaxID=2775420 RepID=A0ABX7BJ34_9PROT|nr:conjugal transfer protein TrbE [Skermanella sp. TT6]QQP94074.1 conjugal transfer protein TrbE [Skermanella sp. TT6]
MRTLSFRGPDVACLDETSLIAQTVRLNDALRRLRGEYSLHIEAQRVHATDYPGDDLTDDERRALWPDPVSWMFDEERRERFKEVGEHFENRQFISFVYKVPAPTIQRAERMLVKNAHKQPGVDYRGMLGDFLRTTEDIKELLADMVQECEWLDDAGMLEFLHNTVSTHRHPVTPSNGKARIDHDIADCSIIGGNDPMIGDCHLRTVTISSIPETMPAILDALNDVGCEYRWTVRWMPYDHGKGLEVIQDRASDWGMFARPFKDAIAKFMHLDGAGDRSITSDAMTDDAEDALHAAKDEALAMGKLTATVTVWDPSLAQVNKKVQAVIGVIQRRSMVAKRHKLAALDTWLGTLPGHIYADLRQPIRTSVNLAHLIPWAAVWAGHKWNAHLDAPALMHVSGGNTTPFRLNLHHGDLGHTLVLGPPGAGKSTLLNAIRSQYRRYAGAKVISIDIGRSAEVCTRLMGGIVYRVGEAGGIGFQPLARIDDPNWRAWALEWVLNRLKEQNVTITADVKAAVSTALADVAKNPLYERTLTDLSVALPSELKPAINFYCVDGDYGTLLDDNAERLGDSDCVTFEMTALLGNKQVSAAVLEYLFYYMERVVFPGPRPVILLVDEAWRFLGDSAFTSRLNSWLRLLRKLNVVVVFATQFLKDALTGPLSAALNESCPTRILLANEKAMEPETQASYAALGANVAECEQIANMVPKRDYYYSSSSGKRVFELGLGPIGLQLCGSSSPDALARCDRLVAAPSSMSFAERWFAEAKMQWAADLVADETDAPSLFLAAE